MFQESFKGVSRKFKGASMNMEGCLIGVLSGFQVYMKEVQRVFQGRFKGMYQENFKKAFMGVLNVSLMFCIAILFLLGTHRSYPRRRRACLLSF